MGEISHHDVSMAIVRTVLEKYRDSVTFDEIIAKSHLVDGAEKDVTIGGHMATTLWRFMVDKILETITPTPPAALHSRQGESRDG